VHNAMARETGLTFLGQHLYTRVGRRAVKLLVLWHLAVRSTHHYAMEKHTCTDRRSTHAQQGFHHRA
jgi:hypothetical protein